MSKSGFGPRGPRKVPNQIRRTAGSLAPRTSGGASDGPRQPKTIPLSDHPAQSNASNGPRQPKIIPKSLK